MIVILVENKIVLWAKTNEALRKIWNVREGDLFTAFEVKAGKCRELNRTVTKYKSVICLAGGINVVLGFGDTLEQARTLCFHAASNRNDLLKELPGGHEFLSVSGLLYVLEPIEWSFDVSPNTKRNPKLPSGTPAKDVSRPN